ncbi:hypothetical protein ACLB2K_066084 [Fragaria x ananassa]
MALTTQVRASTGSPFPWKYDVFLSFRGEDTRKGFTDYLYDKLQWRGIRTFRDDPELERGTTISPELISAIEQSRFAIVVLSPNYASSTWCLLELCKILECMEERGTILPFFYEVNPSDVRHQRDSFAEAFDEHEEKFGEDSKQVEGWRDALTKVANVAGWNSKGFRTDILTGQSNWKLRVIQNLYPALSRDVTPPPADETPGQLMTGFGFHDVVIETPLHSLHLLDGGIALVLGAYTTRILHFLDGGSSMHGKYPLQKKRPETRPGTSTDGIEHQEPLEPGAVIGELPDPIQPEIDDLFADGVVATGEVVGGVLLAGDELLGVEELAVGTGADLLIAEEEGVLRSSSMKG